MKTKNIKLRKYVIERLLSLNYEVFVSIINSDLAIIKDNIVGRVTLLTTTTATRERTIIDLRNKSNRTYLSLTNYNYVIAVDTSTSRMWLIPIDDIADNRTLNVSNKEHYLITPAEIKKDTIISEIAIKEATLETLDKITKKSKNNHSEHDNQRNMINGILNFD